MNAVKSPKLIKRNVATMIFCVMRYATSNCYQCSNIDGIMTVCKIIWPLYVTLMGIVVIMSNVLYVLSS